MPPETSAQPQLQQQNLAVPVAIVIAGALIAAAVYFSGNTGVQPPQNGLNTTKQQMKALINTNRTQPVIDEKAKGGKERYIGKADAPVTVKYWFDYQCPFCKQFEETAMETLITKYVNTGKVRIVFMDYPFLGNDSGVAAEYAQAIWELYPEKFFTWHAAMFDVQDAEGDQGFGDAQTIDTLISLVPGIDDAKVKAAIQANKDAYDAQILAEQKAGQDGGVTGTPGFLIGTQLISGAQPLDTFVQAIDAALAGN